MDLFSVLLLRKKWRRNWIKFYNLKHILQRYILHSFLFKKSVSQNLKAKVTICFYSCTQLGLFFQVVTQNTFIFILGAYCLPAHVRTWSSMSLVSSLLAATIWVRLRASPSWSPFPPRFYILTYKYMEWFTRGLDIKVFLPTLLLYIDIQVYGMIYTWIGY